MKQFEWKPLDTCRLERVDTPQGRYYERRFDDGNILYYPSVTTCLKDYFGDEWLVAWKKKVGEEHARQVSTQAKNRGNEMHSIYERYLRNEDYKADTMPFSLADFIKVRPMLNEHINLVYGVELFMFSDTLQAAGACDTICEWDGVPTVLDYKTSKRNKKEDDILNYFIQATAYAIMARERYQLPVSQIKIIMTVDHEDPLVFTKKVVDYEDQATEIFRKARPCLSKLEMQSLLSSSAQS